MCFHTDDALMSFHTVVMFVSKSRTYVGIKLFSLFQLQRRTDDSLTACQGGFGCTSPAIGRTSPAIGAVVPLLRLVGWKVGSTASSFHLPDVRSDEPAGPGVARLGLDANWV